MPESRVFSGTVAVIGGGVMGEAILRGWLQAEAVDPERVTVAEPSLARRDQLGSLGVRLVESAGEALPAALVLVAVKPQIIDSVLTEIAASVTDSLVVSIAGGVSTARIESLLPASARVVRVMPNTPAMVGAGMAAVSGGGEATAEDVDLVAFLFDAIGKASVIDERYQNAATAISGCGPAYFALVIDALSRAGVAAGLTRPVAQTLAVQTMLGTAQMLEETGMHPAVLIDGVTSPGGSTIAALGRLEADGVRAAFDDAVRAAIARSEELG